MYIHTYINIIQYYIVYIISYHIISYHIIWHDIPRRDRGHRKGGPNVAPSAAASARRSP